MKKTVVVNHHRNSLPKLAVTEASFSPIILPDFLARMKKDFGGKVFADSQPILDEMREDRY